MSHVLERERPFDLLSLRYEDFLRRLKLVAPRASNAAGKIYARAYRTGLIDPEASETTVEVSAEDAARLRKCFVIGRLPLVRAAEEPGEAGRTVKYVFGLEDGNEIEAVAIPMLGDTYTLCVSSQVGCARECAFCETGKMGLIRNLSAGEITAQVFSATAEFGSRFRNIVYMGMGEPLDNLENVLESIEILREQRGFAYSLERITVCTSGNAAALRALRVLAERADGNRERGNLSRLNISVSLNAARNELRDVLMPINRTYPLEVLGETLASFRTRKNFAFGVNYCLIPGLNDSSEDQDAVAAFVSRIGRAMVNVIPYNPGSAPIGKTPTDAEVSDFLAGLHARGVLARRRQEKGRSLMAACGQLGGGRIAGRTR